MASKIKGITVEIGGDTTKLDKALEGVNTELKTTQSDLKQVERLLKLDPGNVTLLTQKQAGLNKAIEGTQKKLDVLKDAAEQAKKKLDIGEITQEQYDELTRRVVDTTQSLKKLESQATETTRKLNPMKIPLEEMGSKAELASEKTKKLSAVAAGAVVSLGAMAVKAAGAADDLNTMAKQTGFSTEELQKMQYASDTIDVSMDTIVSAARKMKKNMASTSAEVVSAWNRLGVATRDQAGEFRNATDVFYDAAFALSRIPNETERDILAMQIFGKSADELAGIIDDGGEALRRMGEEAEKNGLILSQDALDGANALNDGIDKLKATAKQAFFEAGATIAQNLLPNIEILVEKVVELLKWIGSLDGRTLALIGTILMMTAALSPLMKIVGNVSYLLANASSIFTVTNLKIMAVVASVALLAGALIAMAQAWDNMSGLEKAVSIIGALTIAAAAAAVAVGAINGPAGAALAVAGIVGGIAAVTAAVHSANKRAKAQNMSAPPSGYSGGGYGQPSGYGGGYGDNRTGAPAQNFTLELDGQVLGRAVTPYIDQNRQRMGVDLAGG